MIKLSLLISERFLSLRDDRVLSSVSLIVIFCSFEMLVEILMIVSLFYEIGSLIDALLNI